jgi:hypothetical protein
VTTGKVIRAIAGLIVLVTILVTVNGWWADYKKAAPSRLSAETTATAEATATAGTGQNGSHPY